MGIDRRDIPGAAMAIREQAKIHVNAIDAIGQFLDHVQEHQSDEVSKSEAIRRLVPQIQSAQSKGYNLKAIASMLSERGLPITPVVLKSYLGQATASHGRKRPRPKARAEAEKRPRTNSERAPGASKGNVENEARSTPPPRLERPPAASAASVMDLTPPAVTQTPIAKPQEPPHKGTFVPRADSQDI